METKEIIEVATALKSEGFKTSEIAEIIASQSAVVVSEKKSIQRTTKTATKTQKAKTDKKSGFSSKAKDRLKDYNVWHKSKNVGAYRQQRKKLVQEVKQNTSLSINQSSYKKGVRTTKPASFVTKNGGIVVEITHYKGNGEAREINFVDEKFMPY